jgi:hypothetical protein
MGHLREGIHAGVFDIYDSDIGVDGTEGEIFRRSGIGFGKCVEKGGFPDIRESNNSYFHRGREKG